jgi:hypothetical protein
VTTTNKAKVPDELKLLYEAAATAPSDINEHVPTLYGLARGLTHITEMGVGRGHSTVAWLMAQPDELVLVDIAYQRVIPTLERVRGRTLLRLIQADSRFVDMGDTDLLFIDTTHTYDVLQAELARNGNKARRYLVFHDTTTFGEVGEDRKSPGLWAAIHNFMACNPHWHVRDRHHNNNGLTVLERQ